MMPNTWPRWVRTILIAASLAFLAVLLSGCGGGESERAANAITISSGGEPKSLDPQIVTGLIEERILSALFEGLVNIDYATLDPIPGVAESWTISDDGTVYIFHLREDARWSNGDPVTAQDFAYSWERMLSPDLAAEYAYMLYPIRNAEAFNTGELTDFSEVGVQAVDERTLRVELRAPTPYFLTLQIHFSFYPVHPATIEAHGDMTERDTAWTRAGNHVSNGPFRLTRWIPNKEIVAERATTYWSADDVALERITFRPVQDPSAEERLFRAGELQMTTALPTAKVETYETDRPSALHSDPYIATEFVRFNTQREPFDDARVRMAMSLAIDRQRLVEFVMKSGQIPAHSFVPPGLGRYGYGSHDVSIFDAPENAPMHRLNVARARELLAEAGYPHGDGFPDVIMLFDTNDNVRRYCEALQRMWQENLGIHVSLQNQDGKTWLSNMIALDYDLARSFWVADYPDPSNFLEMFYSTSGNNRTGFSDPVYEDLLRRAALETDAQARAAIFDAAERRLMAAAPIAPVYFQTRTFLMDERIDGFVPNSLGRVDYRRLSIRDALSDN